MTVRRLDDLRAAVLGIGGALAVYYGFAATQVLAGNSSLDRPVTWLGLVAGVAALGWVLTSGISARRRNQAGL
jgi:hypothetical protein